MIKLRDIISEAKVVTTLKEAIDIEPIVKKIEKLTDRNAHTDAVLELAKFMKMKSFENILESMLDMQKEYGHTPKELIDLRTKIYNELIKQCESKYGREVSNQINAAF